MNKLVHGEIQYDNGQGSIHSDICPPGHDFNRIDDEYKKFLHLVLDEWLENSNGTGFFYIAEEGFKYD